MASASPARIYVDSSVLVAAFATDDERRPKVSAWLPVVLDRLATSSLSEVEVIRALARRATPPSLLADADELLDQIWLLDVTTDIREAAIAVRPTILRSLDALHVATAVQAGAEDFATFDQRQGVAAEEMGLRLVSPALR
ncbi:MAG: type II toxin-antitoxin system VapC family toxin [Candidatus Dormibacteraeota bacterium]|nr:type II toxin-antitoxin system VapC family toxin [Candidatus Dormibacteraeota bacterium]